jgi:hypothetical protein
VVAGTSPAMTRSRAVASDHPPLPCPPILV